MLAEHSPPLLLGLSTITMNLQKFARHIALPDFFEANLLRLQRATAVVVGAGGLGVPIVQCLAAAGVGAIRVIDFDKIELSNLPRQSLYGQSDVGLWKVEVLEQRMREWHPELRFEGVRDKLHAHNAAELLAGAQLVIDATDQFAVRFLINDVCSHMSIPLLSAAVTGYEGQWVIFSGQKNEPNYRDVFLHAPGEGLIGNCEVNGVLSTAAAVVGALAANSALRFLAGLPEATGKMHLYHTADQHLFHADVPLNEENPLRKKTYSFGDLNADYAGLCVSSEVAELTVSDVKKWLADHTDMVLVDVRTQPERDQYHIGGLHLPLHEFAERLHELPEQAPIVLYCQKGIRSWDAAAYLRLYRPEQKIYSLAGGMSAWIQHPNA